MPTEVIGKEQKPLALLIDRGAGSRNIRNTDEIFRAMVEGCPHCQVEIVRYHIMSTEEQIRITSRASVLVGLHGSGLTHVVWMHPSAPEHPTHMIEFLPYRYSCRDWYHTAAIVAGVDYHIVMNKNPPDDVHDSGLANCWNRSEICATLNCHDRLRDQATTIELDTFTETWLEVAESLKGTIIPPETSGE
jgi:capsular polysaccharide biosynthesis protein